MASHKSVRYLESVESVAVKSQRSQTCLIELCILKKLVFQSHVRLRLKTDTGTEDIGQGTSLLGKCVDNRCFRRSERSLKHLAENAEHAMKTFIVFRGSTVIGLCLPGDTSHHFRNEDQINDEWRSQQ